MSQSREELYEEIRELDRQVEMVSLERRKACPQAVDADTPEAEVLQTVTDECWKLWKQERDLKETLNELTRRMATGNKP